MTEESNQQAAKNFAMIEGWKASGQSQAQYCKDHQISLSNFTYWVKKYKSSQATVPTEGCFVEVKVGKSKVLPSPAAINDERIIYRNVLNGQLKMSMSLATVQSGVMNSKRIPRRWKQSSTI